MGFGGPLAYFAWADLDAPSLDFFPKAGLSVPPRRLAERPSAPGACAAPPAAAQRSASWPRPAGACAEFARFWVGRGGWFLGGTFPERSITGLDL